MPPGPRVTPCVCGVIASPWVGTSLAGWQLAQRAEKNTFTASLKAARAFSGLGARGMSDSLTVEASTRRSSSPRFDQANPASIRHEVTITNSFRPVLFDLMADAPRLISIPRAGWEGCELVYLSQRRSRWRPQALSGACRVRRLRRVS